MDRPAGAFEDAVSAGDADVLAQWARYFRFNQEVGMRSLLSVCRVVEEIGYVLAGKRFDETESVWNVAAAVARERGDGARVAEVEASYQSSPEIGTKSQSSNS